MSKLERAKLAGSINKHGCMIGIFYSLPGPTHGVAWPVFFYTVEKAAEFVYRRHEGYKGESQEGIADSFSLWARDAEPGECDCFWDVMFAVAFRHEPGEGICEVEDYEHYEEITGEQP